MLIIAEAGSSPAPTWDFAQWCEGARAVGADAIKMQLFKAEHFPEAEQDSKRALEFPRARIAEYVLAARAYGLMAGASVFDHHAADLCVDSRMDFIKLAAREQNNQNLIGWTSYITGELGHIPVYRSISDTKYFLDDEGFITLFALQSYPAGMVRSVFALLRAAAFFKSRGARWGHSSHTRGDLDCVIAARLGAEVLEKHFALGTDSLEAGHSLLPHQFKRMVEKCR